MIDMPKEFWWTVQHMLLCDLLAGTLLGVAMSMAALAGRDLYIRWEAFCDRVEAEVNRRIEERRKAE